MNRTVAVVAALLLVAPIVVAMTVPAAPSASLAAGESGPTAPTETAEIAPSNGTAPQVRSRNESSNPHINPNEAASPGNLTAVRQWLAINIEDVLVACARDISLNRTSNGTCQPLVDNETYPSLVSRYRTVASETATSNDDRIAGVLDQVDDRQVEFVRVVMTYRTTLESYREAKRQSQSRRALELARRISILAGRLQTIESRLSDDYDLLSSGGIMSLRPARRIVVAASTNATRTAERIGAEEFSVPTMTLSANRTAASFANPAVLSGQLRNQQGAALSGRPIVVETPGGPIQTRTDENGTFAVRYRPTSASLGNATVIARYQPRNDSIYRQTSVETTISIKSTVGRLRVTNTSSVVRFGNQLRVSGVVRVNGTAVPNLSLVVTVGERQFASGETDDSGRFSITRRVPSSIAPGNRTVTIRPADGERAVTTNPASATVRVESTTPRLIVGAERLDVDTVRLFGQMSVGDTGVADARLRFRRNGESVAVVRLDETGRFETNVSLSGVPAGSTAVVTAIYDPPRGNLESLTLQVEAGTAPRRLPDAAGLRERVTGWLNQIFGLEPRPLAIGVLAVLAVFLITMGTAYSRGSSIGVGPRWLPGTGDEQRDARMTDSSGEALHQMGLGRPDEIPGESLLEVARTRLDTGRTDDAVIAAYGAVRANLARTLDADLSLTHWELLVVHRDTLDDEGQVALERLTATYESAAFSSVRSPMVTAHKALDAAAAIIDSLSSQSGYVIEQSAEAPATTSDRSPFVRLRDRLLDRESTLPPTAVIGVLCGGIVFSEAFLYFGYLQASLWGHLITLAACTLVPVWLSTGGESFSDTIASIRTLALVPLFRLINLGMQAFFEVTVLSLPLVYIAFLPALYLATRLVPSPQFVSAQDGIEMSLLLPAAVGLGALLAAVEYTVLSPAPLISSLTIADLLVLSLVMVAVVGPVEEYLFRGLLQRTFQRQFGRWVGIAAASGLFGAIHSIYASPAGLAVGATVGLILGVLYDVTENLPLVAVIHGTLNLCLFGVFPLTGPVFLI